VVGNNHGNMDVFFRKLKQCSDTIKNATIVFVKRVHNRNIVDEEFHNLIEYVEHKLLVKTIMGLEV